MADIKHPGTEFQGRTVLEPRGKSWVPWMRGERDHVHDENAIHGWEREFLLECLLFISIVKVRHIECTDVWPNAVFEQAAIRQGKWKAVWLPPPTGNGNGSCTIFRKVSRSTPPAHEYTLSPRLNLFHT